MTDDVGPLFAPGEADRWAGAFGYPTAKDWSDSWFDGGAGPDKFGVSLNTTGLPATLVAILQGSPAAVAAASSRYKAIADQLGQAAEGIKQSHVPYTEFNNTFSTPEYNAALDEHVARTGGMAGLIHQAAAEVMIYARALAGYQAIAQKLAKQWNDAYFAKKNADAKMENARACADIVTMSNEAIAGENAEKQLDAIVKAAGALWDKVYGDAATVKSALRGFADGLELARGGDELRAALAGAGGLATGGLLAYGARAFLPLPIGLAVGAAQAGWEIG
ncbi:MAG: hypothetical protein ACRCYU_15075, partial [Nocardioides sp.]